jgi:hypothetical protein
MDHTGYRRSAGHDLRNRIDSDIRRIFSRHIIQYLGAPYHNGELQPGVGKTKLLQKELVEDDLPAVVRNQQKAFGVPATVGKSPVYLQLPVCCSERSFIARLPSKQLASMFDHGPGAVSTVLYLGCFLWSTATSHTGAFVLRIPQSFSL